MYPQPKPLLVAFNSSTSAVDGTRRTQVMLAQHSAAILAELDAKIVDVDKAAAIAASWHPVATDHAEPVHGSPEPPD